jgi:hypothetical protein
MYEGINDFPISCLPCKVSLCFPAYLEAIEDIEGIIIMS